MKDVSAWIENRQHFTSCCRPLLERCDVSAKKLVEALLAMDLGFDRTKKLVFAKIPFPPTQAPARSLLRQCVPPVDLGAFLWSASDERLSCSLLFSALQAGRPPHVKSENVKNAPPPKALEPGEAGTAERGAAALAAF
jgi:hypothetical protein